MHRVCLQLQLIKEREYDVRLRKLDSWSFTQYWYCTTNAQDSFKLSQTRAEFENHEMTTRRSKLTSTEDVINTTWHWTSERHEGLWQIHRKRLVFESLRLHYGRRGVLLRDVCIEALSLSKWKPMRPWTADIARAGVCSRSCPSGWSRRRNARHCWLIACLLSCLILLVRTYNLFFGGNRCFVAEGAHLLPSSVWNVRRLQRGCVGVGGRFEIGIASAFWII